MRGSQSRKYTDKNLQLDCTRDVSFPFPMSKRACLHGVSYKGGDVGRGEKKMEEKEGGEEESNDRF